MITPLLCIAMAGSPVEHTVNGQVFTLPAGFTIEVVAKSPLVDRPIGACFDDQGRLYVTDSSGSNDNVQKQLADKPHRLVRLQDSDNDGVFDKSIVFADKLMFPEGVLWHDGAIYVSAPPSIWKLTDTDGDGVADQRVEWFQGKTLTGCANDLHGPYLGPDGWIYWCKGAFAEQTYARPGKPAFVTKASHIFRCRPDGSGIEPVMTGGMDNPVDVTFTTTGERIFTTTFFVHPGGGQRDGLIHAIYGGVYGKDHNVLDNHKRTGELMPVLSHMGAAAPCGLTRFESTNWGAEFQNNLFACQFNLRKVSRHVLRAAGSGLASIDSDFLVSNNLDFHPTDVVEDADGSLLVVDTGGWYKLCCPTSQLHKPDILGAIYRVRYSSAPKSQDPRGVSIAWSELTAERALALLDSPSPTVRNRAIARLASLPQAAETIARALKNPALSEIAQRNAVWSLARIENKEARLATRIALRSKLDSVRETALQVVSLHRDADAERDLVARLKEVTSQSTKPNQELRLIVECLGRIGSKSAVADLLSAAKWTAGDRTFEHAIIYALMEIDDAKATRNGMASSDANVVRCALIALNQMNHSDLSPREVAERFLSPDKSVADAADWILRQRPEWGGELAGFLEQQLEKDTGASPNDAVDQQLSRFAGSPAIQAMMAQIADQVKAPVERRRRVLAAMERSGLPEMPALWSAPLARLVTSQDALGPLATRVARAYSHARKPHPNLQSSLLKVGSDSEKDHETRLNAVWAYAGSLPNLPEDLKPLLREQLLDDESAEKRSRAVDILAKAPLGASDFTSLLSVLPKVGPLERDRVLGLFEKSADADVGKALLKTLADSAKFPGLRIDTVKSALAKQPPAVQQQAETLYAKLNVDLAQARMRVEQLLPQMSKGDVRRGQAIFHNQKNACIGCHAMGYVGGNIGPDLTRIGQVRQPRDLLESILYPSLSFVRSYEPVIVATKEGKIHSGLVRRDNADELVLATGVKEEVRIAKEQIEAVKPGTVSVMPAGLDKQLSAQDLADLVAFLKANK